MTSKNKTSQDFPFHVQFSGDIGLLQWILEKYRNELPYCGSLYVFCREIGYQKTAVENWKRYGISHKVWNLLHGTLTMAYLMGKIPQNKFNSLESLKDEYEEIIKETSDNLERDKNRLREASKQMREVSKRFESTKQQLQEVSQEVKDLKGIIERSETQLKLYKRELPERNNVLKVQKRYSGNISDKIKEFVAKHPNGCNASKIKSHLQEKPSSVKGTLYRMVKTKDIIKIGKHPKYIYKLNEIKPS